MSINYGQDTADDDALHEKLNQFWAQLMRKSKLYDELYERLPATAAKLPQAVMRAREFMSHLLNEITVGSENLPESQRLGMEFELLGQLKPLFLGYLRAIEDIAAKRS